MSALISSLRCHRHVCWCEAIVKVDNAPRALDIRDARDEGVFVIPGARARWRLYSGSPHRCGCLDSTRCWFATDVRCLEQFPGWR
jgi:hypothetical protein